MGRHNASSEHRSRIPNGRTRLVGKGSDPFFQEIAHIPFWAYDPRLPQSVNQSRESLAQTIDLAPTILDYFGIEIPVDVQGETSQIE